MAENLSDVDVAILDLWYELGISKLIEEAVIFSRLRTKFSIGDIDRGIHKLKRDVMISGVLDLPDHTTTVYRLTDERGRPYIKERYWL